MLITKSLNTYFKNTTHESPNRDLKANGIRCVQYIQIGIHLDLQ